MEDFELTLLDRIGVIRDIISKYGEDRFYVSFSGGKDSTVLSHLIDMAVPGNRIPRVYADTGIDLRMIRDFVVEMQRNDDRVIMIKPSVPVKQSLEREGYPFKSKRHAKWVDLYQRLGMRESVKNYLGEGSKKLFQACPQILKYQFSPEFRIRISDHCCKNMKEKPLDDWARQNHRDCAITGIMREEGGRRSNVDCIVKNSHGDIVKFHPMAVVSSAFEHWLIDREHIEICSLYYPPYNFVRTGCKGCPFALFLQHELDTLEKFFPEERTQCEAIWRPVYEEYRKIGYRLKKDKK